jgi:hypothetical protein
MLARRCRSKFAFQRGLPFSGPVINCITFVKSGEPKCCALPDADTGKDLTKWRAAAPGNGSHDLHNNVYPGPLQET